MKIYRPAEVAQMLGLSTLSIRRMQKDGRLDKVKLGVRAVGITEKSINAFIAKNGGIA